MGYLYMEHPIIKWVDDFVDYPDVARIIKEIDNSNAMLLNILTYQSELMRKLDIQRTEEE
jgi:hypothetical protein